MQKTHYGTVTAATKSGDNQTITVSDYFNDGSTYNITSDVFWHPYALTAVGNAIKFVVNEKTDSVIDNTVYNLGATFFTDNNIDGVNGPITLAVAGGPLDITNYEETELLRVVPNPLWNKLHTVKGFLDVSRISNALKFYTGWYAHSINSTEIEDVANIDNTKSHLVIHETVSDDNYTYTYAYYSKGTFVFGDNTLTLNNLTSQRIIELGTYKEDNVTLTNLDNAAAALGFDFFSFSSWGTKEEAVKTAFLTDKNIADVKYNFPTPDKIHRVNYKQKEQQYYIYSGIYRYTLDDFLNNITAYVEE